MPCPVFLPTREVEVQTYTSGRLPLLGEYDGICKADENPYTPDREILFRCCNHGYSRGACPRLPVAAQQSSVRYSVLGRKASSLEIICVEETDYEPQRWHRVEYLMDTAEVTGELPSECIRAQAAAFCKAYVRRFPA